MRVFDPVAGGEALLVIDVGSRVCSLAVFDPVGPGDWCATNSLWLWRWKGAHI